jgi:hypothetical protein
MRMCLAVFMWMLAGLSVVAGQTGTSSIVFDSTSEDLGKITQGEIARHVFAFRNDGPGTLEIKSVETS